MAKVLTDNQHYIDIANAIREKNGTEETYKPGEMAAAIGAIETGGGIPEEALLITGNCQYRFAYNGWNWFVEDYGDKVTTKDITAADFMFSKSTELTDIPFELNFKASSNADLKSMFSECLKLESIPKINNCKPSGRGSLFNGCQYLRHIPEDIADWFDWSYMTKLTSAYSGGSSGLFTACYSLRSVPIEFLRYDNPTVNYSYTYLSSGFSSCYTLDELVGLPLPWTVTYTSNIFTNTFNYCDRLKRLTFEMPGGQPAVKQWKSQIITLTINVGYTGNAQHITGYNSGIKVDKTVKDDATYQALKDDPDWFTSKFEYSRYNHDSAVETINSLPDTSAYLATAGGTNTIKFKGVSGSLTDGGAIDTLTEEEIAVATAKGWTVTLA